MRANRRRAVVASLALIALAACANLWGEPGRLEMSASALGDEWPLTVEEGVLTCYGEPAGGAVNAVTFLAPDGVEYAVNGSALLRGYPEISPIWEFDDPPLRREIRPLLQRGFALCPVFRD
jgi:hypothetical protein